MTRPSWRPESTPELLAAIDAGVLAESHYLEMKQQIGDGASGRKELARDLAQFAVDGGTVIVGVA